MEINLRTTLKAYPQLSKSLLADYVTKEELAAADYVNNSTLDATLSNYVTEVVDPDPNTIYGRQEINGSMEWVSASTPITSDMPLLYGMTDSTEMNSTLIRTLSATVITGGASTCTVEYQPTESGYFWFCSPLVITEVKIRNGFPVNLIEQAGTVSYTSASGVFYNMKCYRIADDIPAIPGVPLIFEITLER